jgi:sterol desaturase/sphingolipid hydroxylase (fatty acid hydroxylase superfamily)
MLTWFNETVTNAVVGALMPISDFIMDGSSRFYWLYCITGIAIAAYAWHKHKRAMKDFEGALFSKEMWLSTSALNDYFIVVLTPVLRLTVLSWTTIHWQAVSNWVSSTLIGFGVTGAATDGTAIMLGFALTLTLFVVDDFLRWLVHYYFHVIPELWEFHKVHHTAEVLNFTTADRQHPVEVIATGAILSLAYGLINGLFIGLFGDNLTVTTVAGANIFLFVFNICGGVLRHSPFWISFGPTVEKWVISPAMHQIHHSDNPKHFDTNMGGSLAVWDRIFGTLYIPKEEEHIKYGIGEETKDFRSLGVIYGRPFAASLDHLRKRFAKGSKSAEQQTAKPLSV